MRDMAAVILLVLLVIASAGAGFYAGNNSRQTITVTATLLTTTTTTTPSTATTTEVMSGCSRPYSISSVEGNNSTSSLIVFELNSTGWACVDFWNNINTSISLLSPHPTVSIIQNERWVVSSNLNVTMEPATIQLPPNSVSFYIFQIEPVNTTKAIYSVGLPDDCWGSILVGVGYSVSELRALQIFLPYTQPGYCPAYSSSPQVVATTNMIPAYTG
jgi:hypothetical protein